MLENTTCKTCEACIEYIGCQLICQRCGRLYSRTNESRHYKSYKCRLSMGRASCSASADRGASEEERPWKRSRGAPSATPRARSESPSEPRREDDGEAERLAGRRGPQSEDDEEGRLAGWRGRSASPSGSSPATTRIPAAGARGTVVSVTGRKRGASARYIIIVSVGGGEGVSGGATLNLRPVRSPVWHY